MKMKNIFFITLLFLPLLFTGCYEISSSKNNNSINDITNNNYKETISLLEGNADTIEEYMLLASAYMNKSGLTLPAVIDKICKSSSNYPNSYMTFVDSIDVATKGCSTALEDVDKATDYYMLVIGNKCDTPNELTDFEKDVCLYKGLVQTVQSANTINYITNTSLKVGVKLVANRLKASSCAMQYASSGESGECTISKVDTIFFPQSNRKYDRIAVYNDGEEFEFLLTNNGEEKREVIVTNGFCTLDNFSTRYNYSDLDKKYYACPISISSTTPEVTISSSLIDSFNQGVSAIMAVSEENSDLVSSITQFQDEITTGSLDSDSSSDSDASSPSDTNSNLNIIDLDDVVSYINTQEPVQNQQ